MDNREKLVSIGLPVCNGAAHLRRTLDSLLSQTYTNIELVISDNASTDNTREICQEYLKKDKRIRYFRQPVNIGIGGNFMFVPREARGDYYMWSADDDWWDPSFVMTLKNALDNNPGYGVAMGSIRQVDGEGAILKEIKYTGDDNLVGLDYGEVLSKILKGRPAYLFLYGLFKMELLKRLLRRPVPACLGGDIVFVAEAAMVTHFYSVPQVLWHKTVYHGEKSARYSKRYGSGDAKKIHGEKLRYFRHVWAMVWRLTTSREASLSRKLSLLPLRLSAFIWDNKHNFIFGISPGAFRFLLNIRNTVRGNRKKNISGESR